MFIIIVAIACIIPIAGFVLALIYFNEYRKPMLSALLCGISFSAIFYGYIADQGGDIYRHMDNLYLFQDIPIYDAFDLLKAQHVSVVFTWDIWSWGIAQLGNFYLLQSSAAFIGYSIITYIIFDYSKINKLPSYRWLPYLLITLVAFPPLDIAVGIRNANALILCGLAIYNYYIKGQNKYSVFFILLIALLLHHSIIIVILIWLILPFFIWHRCLCLLIIFAFISLFNNYQDYMQIFSGSNFMMANLFTNTMYSAATYQNWDFNDSFHYLVSTIWRSWFTISLWICAKAGLKKLQYKKIYMIIYIQL